MIQVVEPLARAARARWVAQVMPGEVAPNDHGEHEERAPYEVYPLELAPEHTERFYGGASNGALWPLLHDVGVPPRYSDADWRSYVEANERFADRAVQAARDRGTGRPVFLIHDYHLLLAPRLIRERSPQATVAQFLHVPWPRPETFLASPWAQALLDGMAGNDLVGLNAEAYAQSARALLAERGVEVEAFAAGIDAAALATQARSVEVEREQARLALELGDRRVVVSVDRSDYTKGIAERLRAIHLLLQRRPELRGRVVFVQIVSPSRTSIDEFAAVVDQARRLAHEINQACGDAGREPILLETERVSQAMLVALYGLADICVVSSLRDGMNLVAKEYVACRRQDDGCLVLSCQTGAAERLTEAVPVDPADTGGFAAALASALEMPIAEQRRRMGELRRRVLSENVYWWGARLFARIGELRP
jgi:trehalose 6-phosphate synthase